MRRRRREKGEWKDNKMKQNRNRLLYQRRMSKWCLNEMVKKEEEMATIKTEMKELITENREIGFTRQISESAMIRRGAGVREIILQKIIETMTIAEESDLQIGRMTALIATVIIGTL